MDYQAYAKEVISSYPIIYQEIEFIRHNENMIFKIIDETGNKAYVLRIHSSKIEGMSGVQHTYEGLKSEMEFLAYLSNYKELMIQRPIVNYHGEYVTIHQGDGEQKQFYSTLLEWVEGVQLTLQEENISEIAYKFGEKVGILHEASRRFKPTEGFIRPSYSISDIKTVGNDLRYGIEIDLFNEEQYELMKKVIDKIIEEIGVLEDRSDAYGMIHADYQLGNIIIHNGEPCFIDFGLSGFSYYLFDLGSATSILDSEMRDTFLHGYSSKAAFSKEDIRNIDCLGLADAFITYMLFIKDEDNRGWIKKSVEKLCNTLFPKFLAGEIIFYS